MHVWRSGAYIEFPDRIQMALDALRLALPDVEFEAVRAAVVRPHQSSSRRAGRDRCWLFIAAMIFCRSKKIIAAIHFSKNS